MFKAPNVLDPTFIQRPSRELWHHVSPCSCIDEDAWLRERLPLAAPKPAERDAITRTATDLIQQVRANSGSTQLIDDFLVECGHVGRSRADQG